MKFVQGIRSLGPQILKSWAGELMDAVAFTTKRLSGSRDLQTLSGLCTGRAA